MAKFLNLLKLRSFANAGDSALEVAVNADDQPRLRVDAGGKLTWGAGGVSAGDTNLYRDSANILKTDDSLTVTGDLTVSGTNTNLNTTNLYTNSGEITLNNTNANADGGVVFKRGVSPEVSLTWYSTGNRWLMDDGSSSHTLGKAVRVSDEAPTTYTPNVGDLWYDTANSVLKLYNWALEWVEVGGGGASITISDTAPVSPEAGDLWFESDTAKTFVYYDSTWVEIGGGGGGSTFEPMNDSQFSAIVTMDIGV